MIGQTLDRYRIDAKLGQGGMGVVYKAHDTRLDRVVAIKVLPPELMASAERAQRFAQEARAASALNHPHIVTVYDLRSDEGVDFIVMEYVEGRTLAQIIPQKGLALTPALRYATQIADALARAHEAGIVHRDLKPSNVIVTPDERVKVLDFGVAKLLDRGVDAATHTTPITDAGIAVGTAAYMSPEQAAGKKIDARSDIFSLGAVMYEMTTGRRPFTADSQVGILAKVLNEDPLAPSSTGAALPPDVERMILRCLRKDPARRYQTMADLKVALEDFATDSSSGALAQPVVARHSRRWPWISAALAVAAAVAVAVAWPLLQRPAAPAVALQAVPLTAVPGVKRFPSFSPDGNHVVFTWTGPNQDNSDIYVQQVGAGTPLRLTTAEAADSAPVWSPDGRSIAFLRQTDAVQHDLRIIPPLGGTERKLTEIRPHGILRAVTMAWCPDSSCVVVTDALGGDRGNALFVVSVATGEKRPLTQLPAGSLADTDPAISPDGTWLAFRRDSAPFSGRLQIVALTRDVTVRGEPRAVTPVLLTAYSPQWMTNDQIVFSAKGALWRLNTASGSTAERLPIGEDGLMPAVSPPLPNRAARLAYVRSYRDTNIWRIDTAAPGAPALMPPVVAIGSTRRDNLPHLTPAGQRLTFMSDRLGESEVWAADISGANAVQLTSLGANPGFPRWSPDGRTVAFHSNAEDNPPGDIYVVSADGGKVTNLTNNPGATDVFPSFSRDGQWLYFSSTRSGAPFIWKIPVTGGEPVKVSPTNGTLGIESVDGASLFYVESATTNGIGPLVVLPLKGGAPIKFADNVFANSFEVIEAGIYYLEAFAADTRLQFFDFATRRSTTVAAKLSQLSACIGVSRDGRSIFFSRVDAATDDLMVIENFR